MKYEFTNRMSNVKASAIREILKATADPKMISFAGGNPAVEAFPVKEIEKISADILKNNPISVLQYGITEGDQGLIEAAISFFNRKETAFKDGDKMLITSGSQPIRFMISVNISVSGLAPSGPATALRTRWTRRSVLVKVPSFSA